MNTYSWIQQHILVELTKQPARLYSQLRPQDAEGNLFTYHLNGLIKDGLIDKSERQYQLTAKGLQFAQTLSLQTGKTRKQPQILSAIICKNTVGEHLLSKWHRQPNIGLVSFPHGMVHFGTPITDTAAQELAEKAGLQGDLKYRGDVYIRYLQGKQTMHHRLVHLFQATDVSHGREDQLRPETSEPFWAKLDTIEPSEFVPGFYEIAQLAEQQPTGIIFADLAICDS